MIPLMSAEEKATASESPLKVAVTLRGTNAMPESFRFWDQHGNEHIAKVKNGALARALALVLVKFRDLNQPTLFRVTMVQRKTKARVNAPKSNVVRLILNSLRDSGRAGYGAIYTLGEKGDYFLHLFIPSKERRKEYVDIATDQICPAKVCIEWDGNFISDSVKLKTLAATIAAKATPPWEIADYAFEATETSPPEIVAAVPAVAKALPIPPKIRKLLDEAEKLTDGDAFADAIPVLEKALKAAISAKHVTAEVKVRIRLSKAVFEANEDFVSGEEHCRKALALLGTEPSITRHSALHGLGDMLLWAGRMDEAGAVIRSSLDVARSFGDQDSVAISLISVSLLESSLGNGLEAAARLDEAILILHQLSIGLDGEKRINNAHALGVCYANKAQLAGNEGRPDEAIAHFAKAQEQHQISNDKLNSGKAHLLVGNLHCGNGDAEEGFQSFKRAMAVFLELKNPLWMARTTKSFAKLNAQHEQWEEAAKAAFAAMHGFEEAKATEERIEAILFAARISAQLLRWSLRKNVQKQIHEICKKAPKHLKDSIAAELSGQMDRVHAEIDEKVRTDEGIGGLLRDAKELAKKEGNHELLADSYLAEAGLRTSKDDSDARKPALEEALEALQKR